LGNRWEVALTVRKLRIAVTGANGMLGASLCSLYHHNHLTCAVHRAYKALAPCSVDLSFDLSDLTALCTGLTNFKPDIVIHCAACVDLQACENHPEIAYKENVEVTENVVRACPDETTLVYISTDQVYGDNPDHSESHEGLKPLNVYGSTKLEGERAVLSGHAKALIVRTNIFGLSTKADRVNSTEWMLDALKKHEAITLFNDYWFSPIYTELLGRKLLELIELEVTGVFNLGARIPCTKYEFGLGLAEAMELPSDNLIPGSLRDFESDVKRSHDMSLDVGKINRLGILLPTYRDSLEAYSKAVKKGVRKN
jgi:dTDP-4-dehydrorhamnose reductase